MVVLAHAGGPRFDAFGAYGVTLFFVLSAYLITGILLRESGRSLRSALRTFYARRFLRIFPAYYLVLAVLLAIDAPGMRVTWPWHVAYLSNWLTALAGFWPPGVAHLWTLSVEEQFYLGWPLLVLLLPRRHLAPACVAFATLAVVSRGMLATKIAEPERIVTPTFAVLDAFAIGALIVWQRPSRNALRRCLAIGIILVAHAAAIRAMSRGYVLILATERLGVALIAAWCIDAAAAGRLGTVLEWRPVRFIGTISYGIYLWHLPIVWMIQHAVRSDPIASEVAKGGWPMLALVSSLTFVVASASWVILERPLNRLKRHFPYCNA